MANKGPAAGLVAVLTGRLLQTRSFSGSSCALQTQGWAAGTYFVRVQSGTATAVQRLVVER